MEMVGNQGILEGRQDGLELRVPVQVAVSEETRRMGEALGRGGSEMKE